MLVVYDCIANQHDLRLVGLAAMICALASFTAISLLHHVRKSTGRMRLVWLVVSAVSSGFGIWATHFVAMLAFSPGIASGYNIVLTFLSLIAAIVLTGAGLAVAVARTFRAGTWVGGMIVGGGIATMHYTGMAAFEVAGQIIWDPTLVAASVVLGALVGAVALPTGLRSAAMKWKACGAVLLTVAICSHHFTAMGAVSILPDPTIEVSRSALPTSWLAVAVALASLVIILLAAAGVALDIRDRRHLRARKQAEQHIRFLAHHDALTGLPNRSSFNNKLDQEIEAALAGGQRLAVLCLDLDRFKEVNDLFGHSAGDTLLQTVASCVTRALDQSQMVARLGGDEFAIVAPGLADPTAAGRIAENILEALRTESGARAQSALVSGSIGIAICPNDAADRQTLLSHADSALGRAKAEGRGTYRFFEASVGAELRSRRELEQDLHHAISRQELSVIYQPQVDMKSGEVVGFEALLRWQHARRGAISPSVFIPIAEESGSILQIGEWVLRTACGEAASWSRRLGVAVNVSAVQLHDANFAQLLHEILFQTGLAAQRLELEITETALIRDLNRTLSTLRQIKALGVRVAMDDFGTGYSSLSNLRAFPFDRIKVDRSFINSIDSNEQAATIVRAVLGLGRGLGVPVIAEGVETSGELEFLVDERCDGAQGYHLGMPAKIEQFRKLTHGLEAPGEPESVISAAPARKPGVAAL